MELDATAVRDAAVDVVAVRRPGLLEESVIAAGDGPALDRPVAVALAVRNVGVAQSVGLAFAVAASTFCPLLVLGIWWRRLTDVGALAGLATGGLGAGGAAIVTIVGYEPGGWTGALLGQPAAWSVPLALAVMVVVSLLTSGREPVHARRFLVRLHTPETLGADRT